MVLDCLVGIQFQLLRVVKLFGNRGVAWHQTIGIYGCNKCVIKSLSDNSQSLHSPQECFKHLCEDKWNGVTMKIWCSTTIYWYSTKVICCNTSIEILQNVSFYTGVFKPFFFQIQVHYEGWAVMFCYEPSCAHKWKDPILLCFDVYCSSVLLFM